MGMAWQNNIPGDRQHVETPKTVNKKGVYTSAMQNLSDIDRMFTRMGLIKRRRWMLCAILLLGLFAYKTLSRGCEKTKVVIKKVKVKEKQKPKASYHKHPLLEELESTRTCSCKYDNDGVSTNLNPGMRGDSEMVARILGGLFISLQSGGGNLMGLRPTDINHMEKCMICNTRENPRFFPKTLGRIQGKQLFVDDYLIDSVENLKRWQEIPLELDGPVIKPTEDWEDRVGFPGSVTHNGTHFMMHYRIVRKDLAKAKGVHHLFNMTIADLIVAATSVDGVKWRKHRTELVDPDGKGHNGVMNFPSSDSCVMRDEYEPKARYRYKMTYNCFQNGWQRYEIDNEYESTYRFRRSIDHTCLATSPDGLHWEDHGRIFGGATDTQPCLWHESPGNYTYILRKDFHTSVAAREIRGTQIYTLSYEDFHEHLDADGPMPFHLLSRFYLDRNTKLERYQHQIYAVTGSQISGVQFGIFSILDWPRLPPEKAWKEATRRPFPKDIVMPYLATSRDAVKYNMHWVYRKEPLKLGKGNKFKYIATAAQIVSYDGYHWVYYTGNKRYHRERWKGTENIRLARYPQDRIVALKPKDLAEPAVVTTKTFVWSKDTMSLRVNIAMHTNTSSLVVALKTTKPRNFSNILGTVDDIQIPNEICFDIHAEMGDSEELQLEFQFRHARLYAFEFSTSRCVVPSGNLEERADKDGEEDAEVVSVAEVASGTTI
mmetsp:Transcript_13059/g.31995  ORF Transcript_13059/g.31995 Transcript_13059/m.31995 type:complete len:714 (-) Transcript_13059:391-2532(-)